MRVAKTIGISFLCPRTIAVKANAALRRNRRKPTDSTVCAVFAVRNDPMIRQAIHIIFLSACILLHAMSVCAAPRAAGRLHSGTGGLRYPGGGHPGHGHQTGPQPAQPTRNGFRNRTHGPGTAARRSPERGFAGGSQLPHPGLRLAHDLFDLHPGTGRPHRPTGDGTQHRQHPLPEQGRLRLRFDGHRADRSAARPPEHAVRTQHDGRRNKRLYPVALHLRRSAAGHGIRQRQHAEIPDFDLLQNKRTGRLLGRSLLFQDRRLLQEPLYR